MSNLYSYKGSFPGDLPIRIRLADKSTRTDPSTFTTDEIASAGFTGPYTLPSYDPSYQGVSWDSETRTLSAITLETADFFGMMREQRNTLLAKSDWTQSSDSPLSSDKKAEWATYRQALRDLPATVGTVKAFTWPTKPE
jgi:hypothetical protein|tara:strand:+ start:412 stop:828 length:417 start_codon:yes stop_codon:yes gene_type:complete